MPGFSCGNGRYIGKLLNAGARVIGYDSSLVTIETVAKAYAAAIQAGRLQIAGYTPDGLVRAVPPRSCDMAMLMFGVLAHTRGGAPRVEALRKVRSLRKHGGRLVVTTPDRALMAVAPPTSEAA